ncbi:MAG TPA: hypothetical protein VHZ56_08605 [Devosia sp.]|nr:hypothetical protein [Devosia sp.]
MSVARYFVFPRERDWVVMLDGQPIGHHGSRKQALNSAIVMADLMGSMRHDADVMVQDEDGLRLAWSYGQDPLPQPAEAAA